MTAEQKSRIERNRAKAKEKRGKVIARAKDENEGASERWRSEQPAAVVRLPSPVQC